MQYSQYTSIYNICQHLQQLLCAACPYAPSSGSLIIESLGSALIVEESLAMLICQCILATPKICFSSWLSPRAVHSASSAFFFLISAMTSLICLPGGYHKNGILKLVFSAPIYIRHMVLCKKHRKQANRDRISVKRSFCLRGSKRLHIKRTNKCCIMLYIPHIQCTVSSSSPRASY